MRNLGSPAALNCHAHVKSAKNFRGFIFFQNLVFHVYFFWNFSQMLDACLFFLKFSPKVWPHVYFFWKCSQKFPKFSPMFISRGVLILTPRYSNQRLKSNTHLSRTLWRKSAPEGRENAEKQAIIMIFWKSKSQCVTVPTSSFGLREWSPGDHHPKPHRPPKPLQLHTRWSPPPTSDHHPSFNVLVVAVLTGKQGFCIQYCAVCGFK